MSDVLPCMSSSACVTVAPRASAIACSPRQTPSSGEPAAIAACTIGMLTPAAAGVPGPGDSSTPSYAAMRSADSSAVERVVAQHLGLGSELLQVAVQRVDEAVVVVDDEDAGHRRSTVESVGATKWSMNGNTQSTQATSDRGEQHEQDQHPHPPGSGQHTPERAVHQAAAPHGRRDLVGRAVGARVEAVEDAVRDDALRPP